MEVELQDQESNIYEGYVDRKRKTAIKGRGGMLAASFVLVVEVMESLAYQANASNLVLYLIQQMHFSPSKAANHVTNFMGTAFLLAILGGFLSNALFTTYQIYIMGALVEFSGLVILTTQARSSSLKPPKCDPIGATVPCQPVHGAKSIMLFSGLYLTALGVGCIKGCLPTHGAQQFDDNTKKGRKHISTFFNYFVFCLAFGCLLAVTFVVWIEDNIGWEWGFGISTLTIMLSIPVFLIGSCFYKNKIPSGSPLTTICKVLIGAIVNVPSSPKDTKKQQQQQQQQQQTVTEQTNLTETLSSNLKFLNNAAINNPAYNFLNCSIQQVEDVKAVIQLIPIFSCTIMLNCCIAQLFTFSIQQASTMNTKIGSLNVPPASLPVFPVLFIVFLVPFYDWVIVPIARKATKTETGISHLQRIGIGLVLSIVAMAVAALVEIKRKRVATSSRLGSHEPLPITFLWIAFQFVFLGSADLFTLAGSMEFFYTETCGNMKSLATSLAFVSLAIGFYLSTVIVSVVNKATAVSGGRGWLSGGSLDGYRLERFYWLMCVLSVVNFVVYLFWANRYKYQSRGAKS